MGRDGYLRLVEIKLKLTACPLTWRTADTATGQVLSEVHKHSWDLSFNSHCSIYHAASHQVLAMCGPGLVVVMDAETFHDTFHIDIGQSSPQAATQIRDLQWSQTSSLLAILSLGPPATGVLPFTKHTCTILIYDTSTGKCLQSVQLPADRAQMAWSSSKELLAVLCSRPYLDQEDVGAPYHPQEVQVLTPASQHAAAVPAACFPLVCEVQYTSWSSCGSLLVTRCDYSGPPYEEYRIFDPDNLALICKLGEEPSWGPRNGPQNNLSAFQPLTGCLITFHHGSSGWQASELCLPEVSNAAAFSPCGKYLVLKVTASKQLPRRLSSYDLDEHHQQQIVAYPRCDSWPATSWVPLPLGWRQLFAFVDRQSLPEGVQAWDSVNLMAVASHKLLWSWEQSEIIDMAGCPEGIETNKLPNKESGQWMLTASIMWASNSKHLIVSSPPYSFVVTFCHDD